jgi:hypothetical protein
MMSRRREVVLVCAYFLVVSSLLTWPLLPRMTEALSSSPDSLLNAWAMSWTFHSLSRHPLSLFDANIFFPRPDTLAYSEHLFGISVLVSPLFAATANLPLAYNVAFLASFVLSGIGMYLLVRELTGSPWAAVASGTIFLAAPYRFGHLLQIQLLTLQWFPFLFWCVLRFLRHGQRRHLGGAVIFATLQALSSNYYLLYLALSVVLFALVLAIAGRELVTRRNLALLALGAVAVLTLCLPFVLPYLRTREQGFYRRYEDVVHHSASLGDYFAPSRFNRTPYERWLPPADRPEKTLLPGLAAMAFALAGVFTRDQGEPGRRVFRLFAIAITATAVLLSLGPELRWGSSVFPLPYRFFYRHLPGFGGIRVPARMAVLALFGIAVLAGLGISTLIEKRKRVLGIAFVALLLLEYRTYSLEDVFPRAPAPSPAHQWLARKETSGAVLVLPIHEGSDIVKESLAMYQSTAHFRPLVNGYSGWWPNDYWELVGRLRSFPTARSLRFLLERAPIRFILVQYDRIPAPRRRELERGMERYQEKIPLVFRLGDEAVYEIAGPLDRS